jgi:hypothetical protein
MLSAMRKALILFSRARTAKPVQWYVAFLADDAKTSIGTPRLVRDLDSLLRMVDKLHGNGARVHTSILNWGQGSEWIELSDEQCRYFGIG